MIKIKLIEIYFIHLHFLNCFANYFIINKFKQYFNLIIKLLIIK